MPSPRQRRSPAGAALRKRRVAAPSFVENEDAIVVTNGDGVWTLRGAMTPARRFPPRARLHNEIRARLLQKRSVKLSKTFWQPALGTALRGETSGGAGARGESLRALLRPLCWW